MQQKKYLRCSRFAVIDGRIPAVFGISRSMLRCAAGYFAWRSMLRVHSAEWSPVSVVLVDDARSSEAHKAVMGIDGATDVITEVFNPMPGEKGAVAGELIVNTDCALRAAPRRKSWSPLKELLLYIAHGMDHLSGADDSTFAERMRMRRRELSWIAAFQSVSGFSI